MYDTSLYSTPILWSDSVAGPLNGEVVASWRNTSRNAFSEGVKILISGSPFPGVLVCVCLLMATRACFVWEHRDSRLGRSLTTCPYYTAGLVDATIRRAPRLRWTCAPSPSLRMPL